MFTLLILYPLVVFIRTAEAARERRIEMETESAQATEAAPTGSVPSPPFRVTPDGFIGLPSMEVVGTESFIGDVYTNPEGSEMAAGFFELFHTEEPLLYEYTYDEMKVVVKGEFRLESVDTGQVLVAKERDVIFFPKGSNILFSTPEHGLAFYVGHRSFAP
jgi:ethanolamine utilization protein EutQ